MLIDTHCHLDSDSGNKRPEDLVREAKLAGVEILLTPATNAESSKVVAGISERYEDVFHAVGIHPHEAAKAKPEDFAEISALSQHPKCKAIGEIGLDYHYGFSPPATQISVLKELLAVAADRKLPAIIHSREAEEDLLGLLKEYCSKLTKGDCPGVIHCFTGTRAFGEACLDMGFYISFAGILTFKNALEIQSCARDFPLDRILLETDAPYLAPVPFRGKRCEPSMVKTTAQKLAELRQKSLEEIAQITSENAIKLFKFKF